MIKWKKTIIGLVVSSMILGNCTTVFAKGANIQQKENNLTDEEFLGIWDEQNNKWSVEPSINYQYSINLGEVEQAVKKGNYDEAKLELLEYYRNTNRKVEASEKEEPSYGQIEMLMEDIYTSVAPIGKSTVLPTKQTISIDVISKVKTDIRNGQNNFSVLIIGRDKNQEAIFDSKEGKNPPVLNLMVDGKEVNIKATSDTYIRAGKYSKENYGRESSLYVNDSGVPFDDNTKRVYMQFDLKNIKSNSKVTEANIQLHGHTTNSNSMEVLAFNSEQITVDEYTKNWSNSKTKTLSFKGGDGEFENLPFLAGRDGVDVQYHNTMSRFWYFMRLVGAYKEKGEEKYAKRFLEEIVSYYSKFGGGDLLIPIKDRDYNDTLNAGFRLDMTVSAYWGLVNSESMTPDINLQYLKFLHDDAEFLSNPKTFWEHGAKNNNWGMNQTMGMVEVLTYFPEFENTSAQLAEAAKRMEFLLNKLIRPDGTYIEANNGYPVEVLHDIIVYKENMESIGYKLPESLETMLKKFAHYFMNALEPNGYLTEYGDDKYNFNEELLSNLEKLGELFKDNNLIYLGSQGKRGIVPNHTSVAYPDGNIMISRTGWDKDDIFMFTNWEPFATHSHNDALNLTLYGYGRRLLVDTSDRSYNDEFISNWQRKSRASHNVVEIDGTTAYTGWTGDASKKLSSNGSTIISDAYDIMDGSYTEKREDGMYTQNRNTLFIKPLNFFIVSDYMQAPKGEHEYRQNWHMDPLANMSLDNNKVASSQFSTGGNIQVVPADKDKLTATVETGYYNTTTHNYVSYYQKVDGDAVYNTVLYPYAEDDNTKVTVERIELDVEETTASAIDINLKKEDVTVGNGKYYISYEKLPESRNFGNEQTDGRLAYIHKNEANDITYALINDGTVLKTDNTEIITSTECIEDLSIEYNSDTLTINSQQDIEKLGEVKIYASQAIKNVTFNGEKIAFVRKQDKIILNNKEEIEEPSQSTIVEYDSFEDVEIGNKPINWTIGLEGGTVAVQKNPVGDGKALKLQDNKDDKSVSARKYFDAQKGEFEVEFKAMSNNPNQATYFKINSDKTEVIRLKLEKNNLTYLNSDRSFSQSLESIKANTWYNIKLKIDIVNNKCIVYVNDEVKLEGEFLVNVESIDNLQVSTQSLNSKYCTYIDDVKIIN